MTAQACAGLTRRLPSICRPLHSRRVSGGRPTGSAAESRHQQTQTPPNLRSAALIAADGEHRSVAGPPPATGSATSAATAAAEAVDNTNLRTRNPATELTTILRRMEPTQKKGMMQPSGTTTSHGGGRMRDPVAAVAVAAAGGRGGAATVTPLLLAPHQKLREPITVMGATTTAARGRRCCCRSCRRVPSGRCSYGGETAAEERAAWTRGPRRQAQTVSNSSPSTRSRELAATRLAPGSHSLRISRCLRLRPRLLRLGTAHAAIVGGAASAGPNALWGGSSRCGARGAMDSEGGRPVAAAALGPPAASASSHGGHSSSPGCGSSSSSAAPAHSPAWSLLSSRQRPTRAARTCCRIACTSKTPPQAKLLPVPLAMHVLLLALLRPESPQTLVACDIAEILFPQAPECHWQLWFRVMRGAG